MSKGDIKPLLGFLFKISKKIFIISIGIIKFLFTLLDKGVDEIRNNIRFSLTKKLTLSYVFIFILVSLITDIITLLGFYYFVGKNAYSDYSTILITILLISNISGFCLIIFIGSKSSKKILAPIGTMTNMVQEISINDLNKRLDIKGSKNELKDLAITFNETLNRLQESIEKQNQFVSDASHELRTPIAVIQGYINMLDRWGKNDENVLDESIEAIKIESQNMKHLVENLLFLARGDKYTQKVDKREFPLDLLMEEVFTETKLIDDKHTIVMDRNDKIILYADRDLIKQALRIFLDNSIKYTHQGGTIRLNSLLENNKATIIIEDTGMGIAEDHLPHIFDRFYRTDKSRTRESGGTGLGLSIAKWIIDNHSATISIESKLYEGTKITVKFDPA